MESVCNDDEMHSYNPFDEHSSQEQIKSERPSSSDSVNKDLKEVNKNIAALDKLRKSYKEDDIYIEKSANKRSSTSSRSSQGRKKLSSKRRSRNSSISRELSKKRYNRDLKSKQYNDNCSRDDKYSRKKSSRTHSRRRSRSRHRRHSKDPHKSRKSSRYQLSHKKRRTPSSQSSDHSKDSCRRNRYSPSKHYHSQRRRSDSSERYSYNRHDYVRTDDCFSDKHSESTRRVDTHTDRYHYHHNQSSSAAMRSSVQVPIKSYDRNNRIMTSVKNDMTRAHARNSYIDCVPITHPSYAPSNVINSSQPCINRQHKIPRITNLIEIIPTVSVQDNEPDSVENTNERTTVELQNNDTADDNKSPYEFHHNDRNVSDERVETLNESIESYSQNYSSADGHQNTFNIGGLSDCLVEEMLQEEELKQMEENKLRQERALDEDRLSDCRFEMQSMLDVISIVNDRLCNVAFLERETDKQLKKSSLTELATRPFKVRSWLCNVNVEDLKRLNQTPQITTKLNISDIKNPKNTNTLCSPPIDDQLISKPLSDDIKVENTSTKRHYDQPNDIDVLMQKIFRQKESSEHVANWLQDDTCDKSTELFVSDGDEPYDPEVEEERLQRKRSGLLNDMNFELSSDDRLIQYKQKKMHMDEVVAVAKECIKPRYVHKEINKEQYKSIMKRTVDKYMRSGRPVSKERINKMINQYIADEKKLFNYSG